MNPIFLTAAAGIIATAAMSATLYLVHWRGIAEGDMIRALGTLLTRNEQNALPVGAAVHFASGIVFAFIYIIGWSTLPPHNLAEYVGLGAVTGFAHGLVVSFLLVATVAESHPLPRFQQAGIGVGISHLVAHVVYGIVVGLVAGGYGLTLTVLPRLAE